MQNRSRCISLIVLACMLIISGSFAYALDYIWYNPAVTTGWGADVNLEGCVAFNMTKNMTMHGATPQAESSGAQEIRLRAGDRSPIKSVAVIGAVYGILEYNLTTNSSYLLCVYSNGGTLGSSTSVTFPMYNKTTGINMTYAAHYQSGWQITPANMWASMVSMINISDVEYYTNTTYILLNSPANNTWNSSDDVFFSFTPNLNATIYGCYVYMNVTGWDNVGHNMTPIVNNSVNTINLAVGDGNWLWDIKCNTTNNQQFWGAANFTFKLDTSMPVLSIVTPKNNSFHINNLNIESTCTDTSAYILNYTLYNSSHILNSTQNSTTSGTSLHLNETYNISLYTWGIYTLNISCSDGHTAQIFNPKAEIKTTDSKIEYTFDGNKIGVEILSDETLKSLNTVKETDRYTIDMEFNNPVDTFRYKLTGDSFVRYYSKYKGHYIIDNKYWFDTEPYASELVEQGKDYIILEVETGGKSKLMTESIGGLNINVTSYTLNFGYYKDISFDASVLENQITNMYISLANVSGTTGIANLVYNNTLYVANLTEYNISSQYTKYTFRPTAPAVAIDTNVTFYFNYTYSDGTTGNTSVLNHTVRDVGVTECYGSNISSLYLVFYDETDLIRLNVSAEINFELIGINATNTSVSPINFTDRSNFSICLTSGNSLVADGYIKYWTTNGFTERYYIINTTLTNVTQTLNLYNFNDSTGISTLNGVTRFSSTYNYFPGAYAKLYRYYAAENLWRLVQMDKSDSFGQIVFHIIELSQDYKILFEYDSVDIYDTGTLKFICTASLCTFTFTIEPAGTAEAIINMHPTYSYNNNTGIVTITWDDTTDSINNVTIDVILMSSTPTSICYLNSNNYSGQYACNISGHYGTIFVTAKEYGSLDTFISEYILHALAGLRDIPTFDKEDATFWVGGIIATVSIAGAMISPVLAIVFAILGLIVVSYLQFNAMITLAFVIPACIIGIIISVLMRNG